LIMASKAAENDSNGCVVIHLGFEFDSRICRSVFLSLRSNGHLTPSTPCCLHPASFFRNSNLLSGCYLIVARLSALGWPFLRNLFSLPCRHGSRQPSSKICLSSDARNDLRWRHRFLVSWSSI
jgi:hypothetical protein